MKTMDNNSSQSEWIVGGMSVQDFLTLGLGEVAYVKPASIDGGQGFAIHAADGVRLAVLATREAAVMAARQNDLEPIQLQ